MAPFTVPDSSSPPSTPGSKPGRQTGNPFSSFASNPSTTPAGPPPSSAASFTPAGPPPSSVLGSSQFQSGDNPFGKISESRKWEQPNFGGQASSKPSTSTQQPFPNTRGGSTTRGHSNFGQSGNSFAQSALPGMEEEEYSDDDDRDAEGEEDEDDNGMDVDARYDDQPNHSRAFPTSSGSNDFRASSDRGFLINPSSGMTYNALRSSKRARMGLSKQNDHQTRSKSAQKAKDSAVSEIARSLAARRDNATVDEPDDLILVTEDIICRAYDDVEEQMPQEGRQQTALSTASKGLVKNWQSHTQAEGGSVANEGINAIGPSESSSPLVKATFLSSLLLRLHHPFGMKEAEERLPLAKPRPATVPEAVKDWLCNDHDNVGDVVKALGKHQPNCTAHTSYWDIILTLAIRGRVDDVLQIFKGSDFQFAWSAVEDGGDRAGYKGNQLHIISKVLNRSRQILERCPGMKSENWDVKGREWGLFRRQVEAALDELIVTAEDEDHPGQGFESTFQAENFGVSGRPGDSLSLSQTARRASSKVPWTVYQRLKDLYAILLGSASEILAYSQDWAEATMALALWWDGDEDDEIAFDQSVSQNRLYKQSKWQGPRYVDVNPEPAYIRRLGYAFERVTEGSGDATFQIDSMNPVEVGLAAIFENDVEAVLGLLQSWSLPVAAAVAEIATLGGWLEESTGMDLMGEFNESDLIVLGSQRNENKISKDSILEVYSTGLFMRGTLVSDDDPPLEREGWELAFEMLPRLNDRDQMEFKVNDFVKEFQLETQEMADKLMSALEGLGLDQSAQKVSEMYSDYVAETSESYGTALVGYARAHNHKKIKNVLDLLMSYCLVQSTAYPTVCDLDRHLSDLLQNPKNALKGVYDTNVQSGEMLRYYLSGYATLRKFYDLRDEELSSERGEKAKHRPLARKRLAAEALLAVVNSASYSIHGGLYDESRESVVQVDGLMALLGEALFFVNQPKRALTDEQVFGLLKAIEDLQTVNSRVYEQCEEFFQSSIRNAHGTEPPSLQSMFKKTHSNLSASAFSFSMIGSQMLGSAPSTRSMGSSGVLVPGGIKRGWDWRAGLPRDVKGADVLKQLRLGLAKQLAMGWTD